MKTQDIINYSWSLVKEESGTAIFWTLTGGVVGLALSVCLLVILWMALKNKDFLGGEAGPKWPRCLLLISWIILLPVSCLISGGTWGLVTAVHKISENQNTIEETVSLAAGKPLNEVFETYSKSPKLSPQEKALLFRQQDDQITISTAELNDKLVELDDSIYEGIKNYFISSKSDETNNSSSLSIPQNVERWVIDSLLKEYNPARLAQEGKLAIDHAEQKFGNHVSAKELSHSIGAIIVKPHTDKVVRSFKISIVIAALIQVVVTVLLSIAIAALLVWIVRSLQKNKTKEV